MFGEDCDLFYGSSISYIHHVAPSTPSSNGAGLPVKLGIWHSMVDARVDYYMNSISNLELLD